MGILIFFQWKFLAIFLLIIASQQAAAIPSLENCSYFFETRELVSPLKGKAQPSPIHRKELVDHVEKMLNRVSEFSTIRELAEAMGIRVWLFGGTASSFLHYSKWDLASRKGILKLQRNRFDYEFSHIFRSSQDIDIVVDALPEVALDFQKNLAERFPYFLGYKKNQWEVRTLRHQMGIPGSLGYKEALLNDTDFGLQNTDSHSIGMIEITRSSNEPLIRDLKHWDSEKSLFLEDALKNRITYLRSPQHFNTSRAASGENPEILSVIRLLVKAFQFDLDFTSQSTGNSRNQIQDIEEIIDKFNPKSITHPVALRRIQDTAKKLIFHAVNLESAIHQLDLLGLRKKLIALGNSSKIDHPSWWLNREPLRSNSVGQAPKGSESLYPTAQELGMTVVAHETTDFLSYESITRAHSGEPNVLISRRNRTGETAIYGDGFYVRQGMLGSRGYGLTIRFKVDPQARLGIDFQKTDVKDWFIFTNKKALQVIPEELEFEWEDLVALAESGKKIEINPSDLALLEKFKKRLTSSKINQELDLLWNSKNNQDLDRLVRILTAFQNSNLSKLISRENIHSVLKNLYSKLPEITPTQTEENIDKYVRFTGPLAQGLDLLGLLQRETYVRTLEKILETFQLSFELRKKIGFEILLNSIQFEKHLEFKKVFTSTEYKQFLMEIKSWSQSSEARKKEFLTQLYRKWNGAIIYAEIDTVFKPFIEAGLFKVNDKNQSNLSILQVASYYDQKDILKWLIENPNFDFNTQDAFGNTEIEQLRLHGKKEWADEIQKRRPESRSRVITLQERIQDDSNPYYPQGAPIVDFVRINAGSFYMGGDKNGTLTTITQPFEIMSVDVVQKMYQEISVLIQNHLGSGFENLKPAHTYYHSGDFNPAYGMSFEQVSTWIRGLNQLSTFDNSEVQAVLKTWLPGHLKGTQYQLPTEAQWEMVSRLGGRAGASYAHGKDSLYLSDYAVFDSTPSSTGMTIPPVGFRKPVFYQGKPLYDLNGLIWHWVSDWYTDRGSTGGVDPQGPTHGSFKVMRGGSFGSSIFGITSDTRFYGAPHVEQLFAGFRLIRCFE